VTRRVFWGLVVVITVLALYPRLTLPEPELTEGVILTPFSNHVLAFVTLAIVGAIGWGLQRRLVLGLALYAVVIELVQSLSPGRETALEDLLASLGGLTVGCALAALFRSAGRWLGRQLSRRAAAAR
jgi:VanZ family protein